MENIKLKNTEILLKYLNCLERVFFIDNKWMGTYASLKSNKNQTYKGVTLYLKKLIEYFESNNLSLLKDSLPLFEDIRKCSEEVNCIVLESQDKPPFTLDEEATQYVVVACPQIEKIFHFKAKGSEELSNSQIPILSKGKINEFFYHPDLPRIKIYSRNFSFSKETSNLSALKFMYTNPKDALDQSNSLKVVNGLAVWDNLVPDPYYGVQIGNLATYFISSIKIKELKRNIEQLKQVILTCEDFEGFEFSFNITTTLYRKIYNETPEEKKYSEPRFLRALVFEGFGEDFRHILSAEKINEEEFKADSFLAAVRFKKCVDRTSLSIPKVLPPEVKEIKNKLYYLPKGYDLDELNIGRNFNNSQHKTLIISQLNKYREFRKILLFHSGWEDIYFNDKENVVEYVPVKIIEKNPFGLHKEFFKNPADKLIFFAKNKEITIFCTNCLDFIDDAKTGNIPPICPRCGTKVLAMLNGSEDKNLFFKDAISLNDKKKLEFYNKLGGLFIPFGKYLYYTLNSTGYSVSTCVKILNELKEIINKNDEDLFFEKLLKVKEQYNRYADIPTIIYGLEKNEVQEL